MIKVLHAPMEIAGNMARMAKAACCDDVEAVSVTYYNNPFVMNCDRCLNIKSLEHDIMYSFARTAMKKYDIFHFHFGMSLLPNFRDLPIIKDMGKKIVFSFWGSDQRAPEWILYQQARFLGFNPPKPFFLNKTLLHNHEMIDRYADVILGFECIPRGQFFYGMIDTNEWSLDEKQKWQSERLLEKEVGKTYFLHAPSNNWKKGTEIILQHFQVLQEEVKLPIRLILVQGVPLEQARQMYAYADFAIDQVGVGTFGLFGLECMSWNIPVLTWQIPLFDEMYNCPPVLNITSKTFRSTIEHCIDVKNFIEMSKTTMGPSVRRWVKENACIHTWKERLRDIYRCLHLGQTDRLNQQANIGWERERDRLQSGIKSDFYLYLKENNVFPRKDFVFDKELYNG